MNPSIASLNFHALTKSFNDFFRKHRRRLVDLSRRETALLEMGALVLVSEHYRLRGYRVSVENAKGGLFRAKLSARGMPYNFSWFKIIKDESAFEVHSNLQVSGAHGDGAIYVVDVAVVAANQTPRKKLKERWLSLENEHLITFVETKKLVIYPMLLAQFVGIVHEILPRFVAVVKTPKSIMPHFYPALVCIGYLSGTSGKIVQGFHDRGYRLSILPNFDRELSALRRGAIDKSPFGRRLDGSLVIPVAAMDKKSLTPLSDDQSGTKVPSLKNSDSNSKDMVSS